MVYKSIKSSFAQSSQRTQSKIRQLAKAKHILDCLGLHSCKYFNFFETFAPLREQLPFFLSEIYELCGAEL